MQDFIGSVRRSLVFKPSGEESTGFGGFVEKVGSSIRKSRIGIFSKPPVHALPPIATPPRNAVRAVPPMEEEPLPPMEGAMEDEPPLIRDRDDIMLKSRAVAIAANSSSKKTQEYIMELEKEVNLLKNLSHPNIVRYLGTAREEDSLNILLEFVPGGSISSLLGKFGSFPESVIRMYTKQLLLGLEYLHKNKIMHRDIKGANILVDNKGCIKLADFGASKKVEALATITGAKSMKGTPYWMAPEVIVQSGHSYSADIWSVGCTVIEMATGKAPWSQQYQEVEPDMRPTASELLKVHPFVTGERRESHQVHRSSLVVSKCLFLDTSFLSSVVFNRSALKFEFMLQNEPRGKEFLQGSEGCWGVGWCQLLGHSPEHFSVRGSLWQPVNYDDDMCRIDDNDDLVLGASTEFKHTRLSSDCNQSFNPMCEPNDDWPCKFDESPELTKSGMEILSSHNVESGNRSFGSIEVDCGFTFPRGQSGPEDDDEVTESKIRAFLDEKALELTKLQTPLYEFYNSLNIARRPSFVGIGNKENVSINCNLPPKSRSPNKVGSRRLSTAIVAEYSSSPGRRVSNIGNVNIRSSEDIKELPLDYQQEPLTPSSRFTEIQRKWKEELDEELERTRGKLAHRQAGAAKTSSPKDLILNRQRDRLRLASPGK
ncbi:hypothetical protein DH2020_035932 [Rehmannia glutinosa]|uniref:Protein kinase domain-containing protein n=1 Tax=Rehmannia glutinosa TaxID=99300 RepID=A0ABR0V5E7_REHGL